MNDWHPRVHFDLEALRSFVTGVELGGFARAADRVGRSASAVSAQLKKLESQIGAPILKKSGRGLVLTPSGELFLSYARRLLALNDEAVAALRGEALSGCVRIGLQEDFGEHLLSRLLGDFARAHPQVMVEVHLVRNTELLRRISEGLLDLALAWDTGLALPHAEDLGSLPLCWIGPKNQALAGAESAQPLPLVLFEAPCVMRSAATAALDAAGRPWRIAVASQSLVGVWTAVGAGLGLTVRTAVGLPDTLQIRHDLPRLPRVGLKLYRANAQASGAVQRLGELVSEAVAALSG
ncbi:MAG: LysR substrate-binding domain-containing protein [Rhodocyclales bacterium]|nr:LysR substrate-binding domain-containing protein [Rhodocyclales bacterium]